MSLDARGSRLIQPLLLAAGASRRFGAQKLLHPLADGTPLVLRAVRNLQQGAGRPLVIIGEAAGPLAGLLEQQGIRYTVCMDAGLGMGHSLAHGAALTSKADGWLIALGDMPAIRPQTIASVRRAMEAGMDLAAPFYRGQRGHPVGIGERFRYDLEILQGDRGAGALLKRHAEDLTMIPCDDPGTLLDIDTQDDLRSLRNA